MPGQLSEPGVGERRVEASLAEDLEKVAATREPSERREEKGPVLGALAGGAGRCGEPEPPLPGGSEPQARRGLLEIPFPEQRREPVSKLRNWRGGLAVLSSPH